MITKTRMIFDGPLQARSRASNQAEGLEPDPESLADLEEYVAGAIDLAEVRARAAAR